MTKLFSSSFEGADKLKIPYVIDNQGNLHLTSTTWNRRYLSIEYPDFQQIAIYLDAGLNGKIGIIDCTVLKLTLNDIPVVYGTGILN